MHARHVGVGNWPKKNGAGLKDFRDLKVWNKARELTLEIYKVSKEFPREELFGLTSQIRRASSSIGANIAEGCGRSGNGDFARFLYIAMGSASELENHLILANDLELLDNLKYARLNSNVVEVKRMLASLIAKVNSERK